MDNFSIEWSSASVLFLIEKLTEKKPVVTEKYELDSRDEPIMLALFGKPALSRFWWNDQTEKCFKPIALNKYVGFDGQLRGWTQARSYGDFWVRTWRQLKVFSISWPFWTIRNLIEGAKNTLAQTDSSQLRPKWMNWTLCSRRRMNGNTNKTQNRLRFLTLTQCGDHRSIRYNRNFFPKNSIFWPRRN